MSSQIPLSPSGFAIVDDADVPELTKFRWYVWNRAGALEVTRNQPGYASGSLQMRRHLVPVPPNHSVAFANGDRLDHRRENLVVVPSGGGVLLDKKRKGSKFGVYRRKSGRFYASKRLPDGTLTHIGSYDSEDDAAAGYDLFVVRHFGPKAVLNFPEDIDAYLAMIREIPDA